MANKPPLSVFAGEKQMFCGATEKVVRGNFDVTEFDVGTTLRLFKNQVEYVADQNWNLPIG